MDRAGRQYWNALWTATEVSSPVDPRDLRLDNYVDRSFHQLFSQLLPTAPPHCSLLEVGCARSRWLPYFSREFGCDVTGLDYSPDGCEQARRMLQKAGVAGRVFEADMFEPPPTLVGRFDVVTSFGLVEHFDATSEAVHALATYLRPGGLLITSIPNMSGMVGVIQRLVDSDVYRIHNPLTRDDLWRAHGLAGLKVQSAHYFLAFNWSVINVAGWSNVRRRITFNRWQSRLTKVLWILEGWGMRVPNNRWTSPYIVCVATTPGHEKFEAEQSCDVRESPHD